MAPQPVATINVDDYLALERTSDQRHEYDGVEIYAMAGGSEQHNQIFINICCSLYVQFRRRDCTVYNSDMRVHIPVTGLYMYPDVSALWGTAQYQDPRRDTLLNPQVIMEVLSPSTEGYDRGKRFRNCRTLPSMQEYLLIDQDAVLVEHYVRQPNGQWLLHEASNSADVLTLTAIDCTLALADMYEKVLDA